MNIFPAHQMLWNLAAQKEAMRTGVSQSAEPQGKKEPSLIDETIKSAVSEIMETISLASEMDPSQIYEIFIHQEFLSRQGMEIDDRTHNFVLKLLEKINLKLNQGENAEKYSNFVQHVSKFQDANPDLIQQLVDAASFRRIMSLKDAIGDDEFALDQIIYS
ncbi:hypothetical protein [Criblamydia sequanensis]|uniref:Uncharacterized protein n=1 Tax=Candidatus Criblamydia sequanensis CRIB-18 TaxID=1437425 RepID=A0A090D1M2_9BACT|nr:hypothetical protein [Criblamydia sequanensis]CDR33613.1 hypothetical protein CSEC_0784 [Criblamydia sequanensis CRIB-18]